MAQFAKVNSQRGAPMGRQGYGNPEDAQSKILLFKVALDSGGYDDGGAYWGLNVQGNSLYCAMDCDPDYRRLISDRLKGVSKDKSLDYRRFIRANSRKQAAELLGIESNQLAKPL